MYPVDADFFPALIGYDLMRELNALPPEQVISVATSVLGELGNDKAFLRANVAPFIKEKALKPGAWSILKSWDDGNTRSSSLHLMAWAPGSGTAPHPHVNWGAMYVIRGRLHEDRFKYIEGRTVLGPDDVEWPRDWEKFDQYSTVKPGLHGLHALENRTTDIAVSLNLYGPGCDRFLRAAARAATPRETLGKSWARR